MLKIIIICSGLILISSVTSHAQQTENLPVNNVFKGTRFINGQSANLANNGELILQIQHRFGDISYGIDEFFGLDQATMRLGFEYGLFRNFNIGVGRSTIFKTYDAYIKYRIFQQTNDFPVTLVATAEGSVPSIKDFFPEEYNNFSDKYAASMQLIFSSSLGPVGLQVSPGYLHTGYLFLEDKKFEIFTLGFGGSVKVSKKVSVNIEYLHHFEDNILANKPLSIGVDLSTGGHLFQLLISNSQAMNNNALYTNTQGNWSRGNIYFGFNLIRKFKLRYTDEDNF